MIDPNDLPETVTRRRPSGTTQTTRGKVLASGFATQSLRCLIQPHRGNLKYEAEGTLQDVTEVLYCNLTQGTTPTDIQYLDTVIRADGSHRRVGYVADEGGQGDHLKVYLIAANSGSASGTGD